MFCKINVRNNWNKMANDKRTLLICCWKLLTCILWTYTGSLGLHNIRANQGRIILFCINYWSFTRWIHFAAGKRETFCSTSWRKREICTCRYTGSAIQAQKIQRPHSPCNSTWSQAWTSGEVSLNIESPNESCELCFLYS